MSFTLSQSAVWRRLAPKASPALAVAHRHLSSTLAGTGLDLASFRQKHEAYRAPSPRPLSPSPTSPTEAVEKTTTPPTPCVVRGRMERVRGHGRIAFLQLRQPPSESVQVVCFGKQLAAQAKAISPESIVEVTGEMRVGEAVPIQSTTCAYHELHAQSITVLSTAATPLPFPLQDTNTKLDTRLNHRAVDLRTPLTSAVLRIVSAVCQSYRTALLELGFVEVHTPKLTAAASESGSAVFEVKYFGANKAYLAQSPQLYKQMTINGDAMRVFEIGPVFRAEQSLTHRHLTEFTGLDAEMVVAERYTEVLDVLEHVMCRVLGDLQNPKKPYAALVRAAMVALQRSPSEAAVDTTTHATAPAAAAAADAKTQQKEKKEKETMEKEGEPKGSELPRVEGSLSDIVYEVSEATVQALGLGNDTAGTAATVDPYHARIGGGTLERSEGSVADSSSSSSSSFDKDSSVLQCPRVLRLSFDDAVRLLTDADGPAVATDGSPIEDFSLPQERRLGELIKVRYGVDLCVVDCWPVAARPFYTMPCDPSSSSPSSSSSVNEPTRTRSYDMYLRGEEICSGAQRQHDAEKLMARLCAMHIALEDNGNGGVLKDYVDSFRYGAWPHGGFGLGLERIVAFFLGAKDVRQVSLFPRDPKRLTP